MAHLKEIVNRINLIASTQQITKAMKMVSASKLHKVQQILLPLKEYVIQYEIILHAALQGMDKAALSRPLIKKRDRHPQHLLYIVISSNRGLCGAFNKNVLKAAHQDIEARRQAHLTSILVIGKKAHQFFKKSNLPIIDHYVNLLEQTDFKGSYKLATYCLENFQQGRYSEILLVYTTFKNAAKQEVTITPLLPLVPIKKYLSLPPTQPLHYIYEPSQQLLIKKLIPEILKNRVMNALVESSASEHAARIVMMGKATDNADELLKTLRICFNRTRQALITNSLAEITSGAEALA